MEFEDNGFLGASDEEDWDREGLFKTVDELCGIKVGHRHLVNHLTPLEKTLPETYSPSIPSKTYTGSVVFNKNPSYGSEGGLSTVSNQALGGEDFVTGTKIGSASNMVNTRISKGPSSAYTRRGPVILKDSRTRKEDKAWKPKKTRCRLVIGMDVRLEETCQLSLCALVGRFSYKHKCNLTFTDWMKEVWQPRLGYIPTYMTLPSGWFSLLFKTPEDAECILNFFLGL
jgi:hypothetical protein